MSRSSSPYAILAGKCLFISNNNNLNLSLSNAPMNTTPYVGSEEQNVKFYFQLPQS